ncbi:MAG: QueT transporter family protein [bacterium]|nr:QueT transporter family protein [bacterium]
MTNKRVLYLTQAAMIAALYVILTHLSNLFGLANGAIQVRVSEALTILPFFTPAAIPGLAVGCFLSNFLTGCAALDIIFGTLATLLGALGSYYLRRYKYLVVLPPILANTIIVPFVLKAAYVDVKDSIPYLMATVGAGEVISAGILGTMLLLALLPYKKVIFKSN